MHACRLQASLTRSARRKAGSKRDLQLPKKEKDTHAECPKDSKRPGIRPWRRYPLPAPEKRAFRTPVGVCEPAFLSARRTEPSSNPKPAHPKERKTGHSHGVSCFLWRCRPDLNRRITVLQTGALPLGYCTKFQLPQHYIKHFLLCQGVREKNL